MFTPAIFTRNHNFWRDPFDEFNEMFPAFFDNGDLEKSFAGFKTDVMEKDGNYVLESELPGFAKEDIHVDLKDDILTISASHKEEKNEEDKNTKYIRKERHSASYSRSFRVANVTHETSARPTTTVFLPSHSPREKLFPRKRRRRSRSNKSLL